MAGAPYRWSERQATDWHSRCSTDGELLVLAYRVRPEAADFYTPTVEFDRLMAEGLSVDVEAYWSAGLPTGRYRADKPDWSYEATARGILAEAGSALDMGTGEGGILASLAPLPKLTVAYEGWWPTVPAAQATLRPLAVHLVVALGSADNVPGPDQQPQPGLPFQAAAFDVALNRHEAFDPVEVRRIVKPRGRFLTEQVGSDQGASVRRLLGLSDDQRLWTADVAVGQLEAAGWVIDEVREDRTPMHFSDIAALISYIRTVPWAFEDLDWNSAKPALQQLHAQSLSKPIGAVSHTFLVLATR
jgi:SAM-dependent methyltransferase